MMQPYNPEIRKLIYIVVLASIVIYSIVKVVPILKDYEMISAPGSIVAGVYFMWIVFDKYIWKWKISRTLGLSHQPNLNGTWSGDIDRVGESNPHKFTMFITQSFSRISIKTKTENSDGHSIRAYFLADGNLGNFELVNFWYCRAKKIDGNSELEEFKGLSQITIHHNNDGSMVLEDYYFTDRNPSTAGQSRLFRQE